MDAIANREFVVGDTYVTERGDVLRVDAIAESGVNTSILLDGEFWHYGSDSASTLRSAVQFHGDFEDVRRNCLRLFAERAAAENAGAESDAAIVPSMGTDRLRTLENSIVDRMREYKLIACVVARETNRLRNMMSAAENELRYVRKVLRALEAYLGIESEVVQVRAGERAPAHESVLVFQRVLAMDEEVGVYTALAGGQLGIDFQSVAVFDRWLADNIDAICSAPKGIVGMVASRQHRLYSDNPWVNMSFDADNRLLHLIIRNGENIWRLSTALGGNSTLFPTAKQDAEMARYMEDVRRDREMGARTIALLLQGIFDRTDLLAPLAQRVNLLDPASYETGQFRLVRDAEDQLPDGHLPYAAWVRSINDQISRGSRIIVAYNRQREGAVASRLRIYKTDAFFPPPPPGVYSVEDVTKPNLGCSQKRYWIYYNPGDTVYPGWSDGDPHQRKNRLAFAVYAGDDFVLHYDKISLADVEYYLRSRVERENYLAKLPLLVEVRKRLLAERAYEADFVALMARRNNVEERVVWTAVDWWKNKTQIKRPLAQDDAKAWRMIEKFMKREETE